MDDQQTTARLRVQSANGGWCAHRGTDTDPIARRAASELLADTLAAYRRTLIDTAAPEDESR
ncbi:hypothetical protein [Saccharopolyspora rosea]|uniref:Uncharacterized protein n=1 Tax=Saccharopolyspora rosea TaxID=524884 RepID=A0ABW3FK52_9PSEU|nr:hypothetical protein [Saccharopolyspora rosea]